MGLLTGLVIITVILILVSCDCCALHPHTLLNTPELIRVRGYPAEVHHVTTRDGYVLQIHRIPRGLTPTARPCARRTHFRTHESKGARWILLEWLNKVYSRENASRCDSARGKRPVVLLMHGVLSSSDDFVLNDPHQALAFMLADAGYDVWLGNARGNTYSRRHVRLSPDQPEFWDFSWDEIAQYDLPDMLAYIRNTTRAPTLDYVGHSMGTTVFFAMMNYYPHINGWIRKMVAMAPSAYIHNIFAGYRLLSIFNQIVGGSASKFETGRLSVEMKTSLANLCSPDALTRGVCLKIIGLVAGPSRHAIERDYLPVIVAHTPAGVATRVLAHYSQLILAQRFQAFDHGPTRNLEKYGSPTPRQYSLKRVTVPVGLFWSQDDWINTPRDVAQIAKELPRVMLNYKVPLRGFNHLDFLWSEDARRLVYIPLMKFLKT
ncbi:gastric triacylglycerol lipase-like [Penaeus monodon]|uniref:gastric triacylglycerol lipase-like n=1 Tax=Penaeus monodon TaxID=6687 RepID=UPI0018A79C3D|nr:gastric triacylglycerol lipase-like [Penaeus monodon]